MRHSLTFRREKGESPPATSEPSPTGSQGWLGDVKQGSWEEEAYGLCAFPGGQKQMMESQN